MDSPYRNIKVEDLKVGMMLAGNPHEVIGVHRKRNGAVWTLLRKIFAVILRRNQSKAI